MGARSAWATCCYEDVLVARVRRLVPAATWRRRYDQINEFERPLVDEGLTLVKVMLHSSHGEQRQRLLDRLEEPTKYWKYWKDNPADLEDRGRWAGGRKAHPDALSRWLTG